MQTQTKSKSRVLVDPLYAYCEKANARYARTEGKKIFGSFSAYVNALIAKDRGVKPRLGIWKTQGESAANRTKAPKKKKH